MKYIGTNSSYRARVIIVFANGKLHIENGRFPLEDGHVSVRVWLSEFTDELATLATLVNVSLHLGNKVSLIHIVKHCKPVERKK